MARSTAQPNKPLSRRILVTVKRDMTEVTPRVIWQHEKALLEEIHNEGTINEVDPTTMDEGYDAKPRADMLPYNKTMDTVAKPSTTLGIGFVFIGNPEVEYARLAEVYGRHPKENVSFVEKIYGRLQTGTFKSLLGAPELSDLPDRQLRGLILDYGYVPDVHKEASAEEKNAAIVKRKALDAMEGADLVKVAEEIGVQLG